jgi:hypothetical protein
MADINKGNYQHSIVKSFDEATESLKTTLTNADVNINVSAFTDSIKIGDGSGDNTTITQIGAKYALDVNVADITLDASNDSVSTKALEETVRIDDASSSVSYFGYASVGASESSSVWKIKKLTTSGSSTKVEFADGNTNYDNSWESRASLTYN